jgi:DNA-directed RNA polymerase specialized sigma24 family protein
MGSGDEARRLIMRVYREPLLAYVRRVRWTSGLHHLPGYEDPESIVNGFFAERLAHDRVLLSWAAERCRFRAWIRSTMRNYLLSLVAIQRQDAVNRQNLEKRVVAGEFETEGPEEAFDLAFRDCIVREAMRAAASKAFALGRGNAWQAFVAHELQGVPYQELVHLVPGTHGQRAAALRRMRSLLVQALRDAVSWPGASEAEIDAELEVLMGAPRDGRHRIGGERDGR